MAKKKYNIDYFKDYAEKRNGKCLSEKYEGYTKKLKFVCEAGHEFETSARCIALGYWCRKCGFERQKLNEYDVREFIKKKGGELLSSYKNSKTKLKVRCYKCNNIFYITYSHVKQGKWCKYCKAFKTAERKRKYNIPYVNNFVKEKYNGVCLSKEYFTTEQKLEFQCEKGHVFHKTFDSILYSKQWCRRCSNNVSDSEEGFRRVIEEVLGVEFPRKKPLWLVNEAGNRMELDGYNEDLGIAFEYQGRQHFEVVTAFKGTQKILEKTQKHDLIKKELCKKHNILLLCPTYKMDESEYREYINSSIDGLQDIHMQKFEYAAE